MSGVIAIIQGIPEIARVYGLWGGVTASVWKMTPAFGGPTAEVGMNLDTV